MLSSCAWSLSHIQFCATPWTVALQAPLSMRIIQARILEWVLQTFSGGSSWPRNQIGVSCIAGGFFTSWETREAHHISITTQKARAWGSFWLVKKRGSQEIPRALATDKPHPNTRCCAGLPALPVSCRVSLAHHPTCQAPLSPSARQEWWHMGDVRAWKMLLNWWTRKSTLLISRSCHNKMPQSGWLRQQRIIFSQFWRLEIRDWGVGRFGFSGGLSSWLADGCLLAVSSHGLFSVCAHPWSLLLLWGHQGDTRWSSC